MLHLKCLRVSERNRMIYKTVPLKGLTDTDAQLVVYARTCDEGVTSIKKRPAVVICPGGGYAICSLREAEPIALKFLEQGIQAFVLFYRVAPHRYPTPQQDAALAIHHVRENAQAYCVDENKISIMGFSAGGHLAASLGVFYDRKCLYEPFSLTKEDIMPNALLLCYPVISALENAHRGSFVNLTGEEDAEKHVPYSLENFVTEHTPPTFLWHTANDPAVPSENSLLFALALKKHNVPYELHIYPDGVHGISLADEETTPEDSPLLYNKYCQRWMKEAVHFILHFLNA